MCMCVCVYIYTAPVSLFYRCSSGFRRRSRHASRRLHWCGWTWRASTCPCRRRRSRRCRRSTAIRCERESPIVFMVHVYVVRYVRTPTIEYIFMLHLCALTRCLLSLFVSSPIVNLLSSFASSLNIEQVIESLLGADWHRGVLDRMMDSVKGYVCTTVNRSAIVLG